MPGVSIVLLAAGGSTRMGRPKQLLSYAGCSLLRRATEAATESGCRPAIIVLGAHAEQLRPELRGLDVTVIVNEAWNRGIGSSIRCGIEHLMSQPDLPRAAIIMLCDQPLITADVLRRLVSAHDNSKKPVTIADYNDTLGPPVVIAAELFPSLLKLPDASGAKQLWLDHPDLLHRVPCPEAGTDIDTPTDYEQLLRHEGC